MNINRDNYEEYFLDFAEGRLTAEQEKILNDFLKFNPDLEAELQEFDLLQLQAEDIHMPGKQKLKKEIPSSTAIVNDLNFEMYAIAYLENDLSDHQRGLFEAFLATDQEYQAGINLMKKTYLKPEYVPYPAKRKLTKRTNRTSLYRILVPVAAAATIALLIIIRTEPLMVSNEIASIPEVVIEGEIEPKKPETVKEVIKEKAAFIQIRKSSRATVPVSNVSRAAQASDNDSENRAKEQQRSQRIALIDAPGMNTTIPDMKEDQLRPRVLPLPSINLSSLAVTERVRYQLDRASDIINEDDVFIWNLAGQGIEGINKLVGSDMSLMASQDEEGSVSGFRFKSKFLNVTAPLE